MKKTAQHLIAEVPSRQSCKISRSSEPNSSGLSVTLRRYSSDGELVTAPERQSVARPKQKRV
jgi:hypothetical protein